MPHKLITLPENVRFIIIGLVLVFLVIRAVLVLLDRSRPNRPAGAAAPRDYGIAGGAICPKCGTPFALSLVSIHAFGFKLERCPNCGSLGFVHRASTEALLAAEAKQAPPAPASPGQEKKDEDLIDDSRYTNLK